MASKLVKSLLVLILCCAQTLQIKGVHTSNDKEQDAPDAHILYDQRQSGKYNIHVVIKDVAIIEVDQNEVSDQSYNDEDYYYDEDDLTIKPLNIKSTTASAKPIPSLGETVTQRQSTISFDENHIIETTSKTLQDIIGSPLSNNFTTTSPKGSDNSSGDVMAPFTTQRTTLDVKSRSKIEPIYAIDEPTHLLPNSNYGIPSQANSRDSKLYTNSRIFKVKVHRNHPTTQVKKPREGCRSHQYRDAGGNCRRKRTSSGSML